MVCTRMKRAVIFILACLLLVTGVPVGNCTAGTEEVNAAQVSSQAKKAIKAYQKLLGKSKMNYFDLKLDTNKLSFSVADINNDGVPELFVNVAKCTNVSHASGYEYVYGFDNGKVKWLCGLDKIKCYYPKGGIVEVDYYGMGNAAQYYKIQNGKSEFIAGIEFNYGNPYKKKPEYNWKHKQVTKAKFNKLLKKYGGKKVTVTESYWHKNTYANRKNMLNLVKW